MTNDGNGNGFLGMNPHGQVSLQQTIQRQQEFSGIPAVVERQKRAAELEERAREHISVDPPYPMPKLLNERRSKYLIIDEFFEYQAVFDRIYVHQVSRHQGDTVGSGLIVMPETTKDREKETACLGIIVSAGLKALDELRSHGIDLGHLVNFVRLSPYRVPVTTIAGRDFNLLVFSAGDVVGSCDLALNLKERTVRTVARELDDGSRVHVHVDENGKDWKPLDVVQYGS